MANDFRVVIFDFDGVIAEQGFRQALAAATGSSEAPIRDLRRQGMIALLKSGYLTGSGSAADFGAELERRTGLRLDTDLLHREVVALSKVRPWILDLSRRLRALGYRTAVLTDHTDWLDEIEARHGFSAAFERVFNSYRLGRCKADAGTFDLVVGLLDLCPEQAIFIDDNPDNVERARSRGLSGLDYLDKPRLLAELEELLGQPIDA